MNTGFKEQVKRGQITASKAIGLLEIEARHNGTSAIFWRSRTRNWLQKKLVTDNKPE